MRPGCLIQPAADDWETIDTRFKVIGRIRLDSEETLGLNDHRFVPLGQFTSSTSDPQLSVSIEGLIRTMVIDLLVTITPDEEVLVPKLHRRVGIAIIQEKGFIPIVKDRICIL